MPTAKPTPGKLLLSPPEFHKFPMAIRHYAGDFLSENIEPQVSDRRS